MQAALETDWGNPSSIHFAGVAARAAVRRAREQVATSLGVSPDTVVFTSGATESNNTVLQSAAARMSASADTLLTCTTEHPAVLETCEQLRERGLRIVELPVDSQGLLDPERFEAALDERVLLASIMWVNNETGVIQPIFELARRARQHGVSFHTDAVQALAKVPLSLGALPIDFASFSAHKLGGPKGVGALYVAQGRRITPWLRGGGQERAWRPGTENVPGIVGFGAACAALAKDPPSELRLAALRDRLWSELQKRVPAAARNGSTDFCVANVLNVSFPGASSEALIEALDLEGIAVAAGSACHSGSGRPSHVLLAMGLSAERSESAIRFSLGRETQDHEIEAVIDLLPGVVRRVREAEA